MAARAEKLGERQFAAISKALADENRFAILERVAASPEAPTCSCVREWLGISQATVSHHLKELADAGLIHLEREGKFARITLRREALDAYARRLSDLSKLA